jgi:hypothetical protein
MDFKLKTQLENSEEIRNILKEVKTSFELEDGRNVDTLLVYLPIADGKSCYVELFQALKNGILANFVLSCSEIEKKLGLNNDANIPEEIFNKVLRKLSKHTAKGELGELILFTLLEIYFNAPKILSKISLKTNRKMPVFGADAVHGQFYNNKFRLYLGESKLHKKFNPAAKKAAASISSAKIKYEEEFDLLDSHMDFPGINEDIETQLLEILNPFSDYEVADTIHSPCFIGFASPEIISKSSSEADFIDEYTKLAQGHIETFYNELEKTHSNIDETALLLLPFSCIDDLVDQFIKSMGIKA